VDGVAENPWQVLREHPEITFDRAPLPEGLDAVVARWPDGDAVIVLGDQLGRRQRNAALMHELVHLERGGGADTEGMPDGWRPVVARDEHQVDDEVARRLVPLEALRAMIRQWVDADLQVTVADVAGEFDVIDEVARRALLLFAETG
jgi:hypothetical protein